MQIFYNCVKLTCFCDKIALQKMLSIGWQEQREDLIRMDWRKSLAIVPHVGTKGKFHHSLKQCDPLQPAGTDTAIQEFRHPKEDRKDL